MTLEQLHRRLAEIGFSGPVSAEHVSFVLSHVDPTKFLYALRAAGKDARARTWLQKLFLRASELVSNPATPSGPLPPEHQVSCPQPAGEQSAPDGATGTGQSPALLADTTFVVADCEATGLDLAADRAIEAAAVLLYPSGDIELTMHTLIDPGIPIPATSSAIHHLTDRDVIGASKLAAVQPTISALGTHFAAHTPDLDAALLDLRDKTWLCTHRLSLHLWPEAPGHSNQVLRYWLDLDVTLPPGLHPHRAAADAIVTAYLLKRELRLLRERRPDLRTVESVIEFAARPAELVYIPFRSHRGMKWSEADESFLVWVVNRNFSPDIHYTAELAIRRLQDG